MVHDFPLKAKERVIPDGTTLPRNLIYRSGRSPALPYPAYEKKQVHGSMYGILLSIFSVRLFSARMRLF